jgi:hypothetical protein
MVWYITAGLYLWTIFKLWLNTIFVVPFQTVDMLWLLVPIWLSWFFSEFFQEKRGTSMGNAITNSVIVFWGSVDWARQTVNLITKAVIKGFLNISSRFFLIAVVFAYSMTIIVLGIKGNPIIKKIARIRVVTYVFVVFTPVLYNKIPLTLNHIAAAVIFFPLFYYVIELTAYIFPNPKAIEERTTEFKI